MTIYSLNGSYIVRNQRYILEDGSATNYLSMCGDVLPGHYSRGLCDLMESWLNDLSYRRLSTFVTLHTGSEVLSKAGIASYAQLKAAQLSAAMVTTSQPAAITQISVVPSVAVYDADGKEVIVMMDDVSVKAQKPHKRIAREDSDAKRLNTTVALVEDSKNEYHCITEGIDKAGDTIYSIEQGIIDTVCKHHDTSNALPIVAITDGARSIRIILEAIFGIAVCIILDWYHLQLKVKNLMSMIASNKQAKELYISDITTLLWKGEAGEAMIYLDNMDKVKNEVKRKELRDYLEKHKGEIINYGLRKEANKCIGSGRGEKANDLVVAHRQKKKGMAWSRRGSSSLAIIRVHHMARERVMAARAFGQ